MPGLVLEAGPRWKGRGSAAWGCGRRYCLCFLVCVSGKRLNVPGRPLLACVACVTPKHGVTECRARGIPKYSRSKGEERRQLEQGRWGEESWFSGCVRKGAAGLRPGALARIRGPSLCQAGCPGKVWELGGPSPSRALGQRTAQSSSRHRGHTSKLPPSQWPTPVPTVFTDTQRPHIVPTMCFSITWGCFYPVYTWKDLGFLPFSTNGWKHSENKPVLFHSGLWPWPLEPLSWGPAGNNQEDEGTRQRDPLIRTYWSESLPVAGGG